MKYKTPIIAPDLDFNTPALRRNRKFRAIKDRLTTMFVGIGGMSVIVAILLIFVYLTYEVVPLFKGASITPWDEQNSTYEVGSDVPSLHLSVEEQNEVGFKLSNNGDVHFFATKDGQVLVKDQLNFGQPEEISAFALENNVSRLFAIASDQGNILVSKPEYDITYPDDQRLITPLLV